MLPFKGRNRVTQPFTYNINSRKGHGGIDIVGDDDKNVRAVASGKVTMVSKWDGHTKTGTQSYGNLVVITEPNGTRHYYAHLDSVSMRLNDNVSVGDKVGVMGNTGNSFGSHLHYEVRTGQKVATRVNPAPYISIVNAKGTYFENEKPIQETPDIFYQVYTKKGWLPMVKNLDDYAGNRFQAFSGLRIGLSSGDVRYRVHTQKHGWLAWVKNYDINTNEGYAGMLGTPIDMVQIDLPDKRFTVEYTVSPLGRNYYSSVKGYNNVDSNGYAGASRKHLDRIKMRVVRK